MSAMNSQYGLSSKFILVIVKANWCPSSVSCQVQIIPAVVGREAYMRALERGSGGVLMGRWLGGCVD